MQTFYQNNNSENLIVLLNGWGMDEKPFDLLKSDYDILFLSDYTNLDFRFDFSKYKKKILIAFSAGVYMAAHLKPVLPEFDLKIAINGSLNLFDTKQGVPENIRLEMETLTLETAFEFRKKLIHNNNHLALFNKNQPNRSLESSLNELSALEKYNTCTTFEFDKVIIGEDDEIIPMKNQIGAWSKYKNTHMLFLEGGHFLFYQFKNFSEIIKL